MAWDWDKLQQQKRSGGGGVPPQMGDVFNKIKGVRGRFPALWLIVIVLFLIYVGASCFYTEAVDEVGMVQRFGKYVRTTPPGLSFKLPSGIEKVTNVKVRFVYKEEFGFRTIKADVKSRFAARRRLFVESLMLTGDLNVAVVPWMCNIVL
jgi:membrane protease subunit HflK